MRPLRLSCLAYLTVALPGSTLGLLWPSMQLSFHQPVGALGILLVSGTTATAISSAATGRVLSRAAVGPLLPLGTVLVALALAVEALAPSLLVVAVGTVLFGLGFGVIDSALNGHAASHFGPRDINWMHASYGLGATIGPLLVTVLLSDGIGWRQAYGAMAVALAAIALVLLLARRSWELPSFAPALSLHGAADVGPPPEVTARSPEPTAGAERPRPPIVVVFSSLTFVAVETGIESAAGIWGYIFLTAGRGLSHEAAGVAVSAYWAMMFAGRAVLGPVAERVGPLPVLGAAVMGVTAGAALMAVPGPGFVAVISIMAVGVAAAPIFPLLTLATGQRAGAADLAWTTRMVGLQVAASAVGSAALPTGLGLAIGASRAGILGPSLLVLGLAMCSVYGLLSCWARHQGS